mmetsp:Transcript_22403/g.66416  ORF Transcript_22403/g.66416 Transcript_22403/m.66416 type:complete len:87 (+) Transcript_22403:347-607(+)
MTDSADYRREPLLVPETSDATSSSSSGLGGRGMNSFGPAEGGADAPGASRASDYQAPASTSVSDRIAGTAAGAGAGAGIVLGRRKP